MVNPAPRLITPSTTGGTEPSCVCPLYHQKASPSKRRVSGPSFNKVQFDHPLQTHHLGHLGESSDQPVRIAAETPFRGASDTGRNGISVVFFRHGPRFRPRTPSVQFDHPFQTHHLGHLGESSDQPVRIAAETPFRGASDTGRNGISVVFFRHGPRFRPRTPSVQFDHPLQTHHLGHLGESSDQPVRIAAETPFRGASDTGRNGISVVFFRHGPGFRPRTPSVQFDHPLQTHHLGHLGESSDQPVRIAAETPFRGASDTGRNGISVVFFRHGPGFRPRTPSVQFDHPLQTHHLGHLGESSDQPVRIAAETPFRGASDTGRNGISVVFFRHGPGFRPRTPSVQFDHPLQTHHLGHLGWSAATANTTRQNRHGNTFPWRFLAMTNARLCLGFAARRALPAPWGQSRRGRTFPRRF